MSGAGDLLALLSNLKARPSPSVATNGQREAPASQPSDKPNSRRPPRASSAQAPAPSSNHNIAQVQPGGVPAIGGNDKTQSLLSLLKFSQPSSIGSSTQQPASLARSRSDNQAATQDPTHSKKSSAAGSDLKSSLSGPPNALASRSGGTRSEHVEPEAQAEYETSQDALLKLLKRSVSTASQTKPAEDSKPPLPSTSSDEHPTPAPTDLQAESQRMEQAQPDFVAVKPNPIRMFGSLSGNEISSLNLTQPVAPPEHKPIFTYTNPFEALNASRKDTPHSSPNPITASNAYAQVGDSQHGADKRQRSEAAPGISSVRHILTPKRPMGPSQHPKPVDEEQTTDPLRSAGLDPRPFGSEVVLPSIELEQEEITPMDRNDTLNARLEKTAVDATFVTSTGHLDASKVSLDREATLAGAEDAPADSWESSDGPPEVASRDVLVYGFPLKPFVSVTITSLPPSKVGLRDGGVMEISRFKKEFDQLDRILASATSKYIAYAFAKHGGMRVIRQDDGCDRQIFKNSGDRISHVSLCTTALNGPSSDEQAILGVGLSGTVYYATISKDGRDLFESDSLESESLIIPPPPPSEVYPSNGELKTRVRRSSRHPEFFAIGRGTSIHLVWPATAMSTKYGVAGANRTVDVEKLYSERPLKITTGKVAKDFTFSEDDTVLVSLDKAGKLKFWDIRGLVDEVNATASRVQALNVSVPVLSLTATATAEKVWPTTVQFVDKVRPYTKCAALRYMLVGLKQNHTLQLWDLALGKIVQEINFPHSTDTDGICTVSYHPSSGIIVLAHPTRNSIFFLHLSAPRYALPLMSQATYLQRIALEGPELPKPESTACISGMRELSFASKGQLLSVDLLPAQKATDTAKEASETQPPMFELYASHSRGVTCLAVQKEDLGWSPDSKVLHPIDNAVDTGIIQVDDLKRPGLVEKVGPVAPTKTTQSSKPSKTKSSTSHPEPVFEAGSATREKLEVSASAANSAASGSLPNGTRNNELKAPGWSSSPEKERKKKKVKGANPTVYTSAKVTDSSKPSIHSEVSGNVVSTAADLGERQLNSTAGDNMSSGRPSQPPFPSTGSSGSKDIPSAGMPTDWLDKEIKKLENSISADFSRHLEKLHQRLSDDRNAQDTAGATRQEAILRLVSSSLSTNVESTLHRIVGQQMQQVVVPAISSVTVQAVHDQVSEALTRSLHSLFPHELGTHLPAAISTALQNPAHIRSLSEKISKRLAPSLETQLMETMRSTIAPTFQKLAMSTIEKATSEIESHMSDRLGTYEADRQRDALAIDKLQDSMQTLMGMMAQLGESQIGFQNRVLKERSGAAYPAETESRQSSTAATAFRPTSTPWHTRQGSSAQPSPIAPPPKKSSEEMEVEEIDTLMTVGNVEGACIKWLQSERSVELFDRAFIKHTPNHLRAAVSPLVAFSVAITVANSFESNVDSRLYWIYTALNMVNVNDPEIASLSSHGPALLGSLISKLEKIDSTSTGQGSGEQIAKIASRVVMKAQDVKAQFDQMNI